MKFAAIKNNKGLSQFVETFISLIFTFAFIMLFLEGSEYVFAAKECKDVATEISRFIEVRGAYDGKTKLEFAEIATYRNMQNPQLDVSGEIRANGNIDLEDKFNVEVTQEIYFFNIKANPVGRASGRSEEYYK
ncbi:MAG: DUF4320 family protein [Oscillospiraceae bacterium]